jgi:hypothetical protein
MRLEVIVMLAAILEAAAIFVTAVFAIKALRAWHAQMIGKDKREIAEETLVLAYKIRAAIAYARLPVVKIGGASRPSELGDFEKLRNSYYAPIERLRTYEDDFARLERQRLLCEVCFEPDAARPLAKLLSIRSSIIRASVGLLAIADDRPLESKEVAKIKEWEAAIWDFGDPADEINVQIDAAVFTIETYCGLELPKKRKVRRFIDAS